MSFSDKKEAKRMFQKLPFYNALNEKPRIKRLNKISIAKMSKAFKKYARSYKIEIIEIKIRWFN